MEGAVWVVEVRLLTFASEGNGKQRRWALPMGGWCNCPTGVGLMHFSHFCVNGA